MATKQQQVRYVAYVPWGGSAPRAVAVFAARHGAGWRLAKREEACGFRALVGLDELHETPAEALGAFAERARQTLQRLEEDVLKARAAYSVALEAWGDATRDGR